MNLTDARLRGRLPALVLIATSWTGCQTESAPVAQRPETGGTAVVGVPAAATTVLPPLAAAALDFEIGALLYPGLNFGEWEDGALTYLPGHPSGLARSWEIDGATLTYHLDPGRRWSDGRPVRSADVTFTFALLADTALALPLSSVTARVDSIGTPDDTTVVFHFDAAYPGMLFDTGVGILPEHVFADVPRDRLSGGLPLPDGMDYADLPVSGPFRLGEWTPDARVVFLRNDGAADPARLDRLVVRVVPDEGTRAAELRAGEIHGAQFNSFRVTRELSEGGFAVAPIPQRGYDYIAWNPAAHEAFGDPRVREALSLAIDRDALIPALDLDGFAEPAWGPYGSLFASLRGSPPHEPLHDVDRARALLAEAGFAEAGALSFEMLVPAGNDRREDAAEIIQSQLDEIGVVVEVRSQEFNSLFGRMLGGDYQSALMGWQVALDPDVATFWADPASPLNVVGFDDPGVAGAIQSALAQTDASAAAPFWREAAEGIAAAYPYAFLWHFDLPFLVHPSLGDVSVDVSGWAAGAWRWTIGQER